jgi:hypothetical protein
MKATVKIKSTGEVLTGLSLADAGDVVSAGEGIILEYQDDAPAPRRGKAARVIDTPALVTDAPADVVEDMVPSASLPGKPPKGKR